MGSLLSQVSSGTLEWLFETAVPELLPRDSEYYTQLAIAENILVAAIGDNQQVYDAWVAFDNALGAVWSESELATFLIGLQLGSNPAQALLESLRDN